MIKYKIGDLLTAPQKCIAHQVNCQGVMGSGVAKAIRNEYPKVYKEYKEFSNYWIHTNKAMLPGYSQIVYTENRYIFNLFGQINYGYDGQRYTSYAHLAIALDRCFSEMCEIGETEIAIPYKMGCDRGGGDWEVVESILKDLSEKYNIDVCVYSLEGYVCR